MPTAGKVLVFLVLLTALVFLGLSGMVLEARHQRYLQLDQLQKRVADLDQAVEELRTGTPQAREEYRTLAQRFDAQVNAFLETKTIDNFRKAVEALNELEKSPTIDDAQWAAAQRSFRDAEAELAQAQSELEKAYADFLGEGPEPGIRGLVAKGLGIELIGDTVQRVQTVINAQRSMSDIERSEGARNLTQLRDLAREQEDERKTLEDVYNDAVQEREVRGQELEQAKVDLVKEKEELADQVERLEKVRAELAALRNDFRATIAKNFEMVKDVKEYEIRIDAGRGVPGAIVSADGAIPTGKIQRIDKEDGTLHLNIGTRAGLKPGAQLHVFRFTPETKYLGKLEITQADSNSSLGRMLPQYRQRSVEAGDTVSSEITPDTAR